MTLIEICKGLAHTTTSDIKDGQWNMAIFTAKIHLKKIVENQEDEELSEKLTSYLANVDQEGYEELQLALANIVLFQFRKHLQEIQQKKLMARTRQYKEDQIETFSQNQIQSFFEQYLTDAKELLGISNFSLEVI